MKPKLSFPIKKKPFFVQTQKSQTQNLNDPQVKSFVPKKKLKAFFSNLKLGLKNVQIGIKRERLKKYQWKMDESSRIDHL